MPRVSSAEGRPRVVIAGAGFAGLTALHELRSAAMRVTLIDRNSYSTFQPLLYQVATAGLTSADVAYPAWIAVRKAGATFRKGEITGIDAAGRRVDLADGTSLGYDYLILAMGVSAAFFGVPGAEEHCMSLYTRRDATLLRDSLMDALERLSAGPQTQGLNITVVGGGATGVELAGTLAELRNIALPASFPAVDRSRMLVRLVELGPGLLAPFRPALSEYAAAELEARGVEVRLNSAIKEVRPGAVILDSGEALASDITVWAAGVAADDLAGKLGLPTGPGGRIRTGHDLRVLGQEAIFAAGDLALVDDQPLPQLAAPAMQQGRHAAAQIRRLDSGQPTQPFRYRDKGIMATIGHRSAVVQLSSGVRLRGTLAWLAWLGLHLIELLGGRNRITAFVNLAWRYLTWSRGGGVIVGDDPPREVS
jgi:NADH dehydrogenase